MIKLVILLISLCFANDTFLVKKYFKSFEGYEHPVIMVEQLDKAFHDRSYYQASYDKFDHLIQVKKLYNNREIYRYDYSYYSNGTIREARIYREDQLVNTISFDKIEQ